MLLDSSHYNLGELCLCVSQLIKIKIVINVYTRTWKTVFWTVYIFYLSRIEKKAQHTQSIFLHAILFPTEIIFWLFNFCLCTLRNWSCMNFILDNRNRISTVTPRIFWCFVLFFPITTISILLLQLHKYILHISHSPKVILEPK